MCHTRLHTPPYSSLQGFNVHVNGSFHASLRYKQLHSLHEQLKRSLPNIMLPPFPSKKLFPLSPGSVQLEERRASLERYIQLSGHHTSEVTYAQSQLNLPLSPLPNCSWTGPHVLQVRVAALLPANRSAGEWGRAEYGGDL